MAPAQIVAGLKLLVTLGTGVPVTFKVALAGLVFVMGMPSPVALKAFFGMLLIRLPVVNEVTRTETVQDPAVDPVCAGTVPPLNDKVVEPDAAVTVPPQVFVTFAGLAMTSPG